MSATFMTMHMSIINFPKCFFSYSLEAVLIYVSEWTSH